MEKLTVGLTESQILEELVHSVGCYESCLGPRALATLLVARSSLGLLEPSEPGWDIHAIITNLDEWGTPTCVGVEEYARLLQSLLTKQIASIEVKYVERSK